MATAAPRGLCVDASPAMLLDLEVGPSVCGGLSRESPRVARVPLCVFAGQLLAHCSQADVPRAGCADLQKRIVAFARSPNPAASAKLQRLVLRQTAARSVSFQAGPATPLRDPPRPPPREVEGSLDARSSGGLSTAGSRSASLRPPSGVPWWRRAGFPASSIMLLHGFVGPLGIAGLLQSRRAPAAPRREVEAAATRPDRPAFRGALAEKDLGVDVLINNAGKG